MNDLLKIAQISDLHIAAGSDAVQEIDVRRNFKQALYSYSVVDSDFIVLSGDLADHGEKGAYEFVAEEMERCKKPWVWIPGNHDDLENAANYFSMPDYVHGKTFDFSMDIKGRHFVFLDNSSGEIQLRQMEWIKQQAAEFELIYLFMHYPPCLCGHAFMDSKYPMKHIEKVQEAFESISNIGGIFCGHYHCAHSLELKNGIPVYVAPATQMQISPTSAEFKLESSLPFWQILNFKGKNLTVEVKNI